MDVDIAKPQLHPSDLFHHSKGAVLHMLKHEALNEGLLVPRHGFDEKQKRLFTSLHLCVDTTPKHGTPWGAHLVCVTMAVVFLVKLV